MFGNRWVLAILAVAILATCPQALGQDRLQPEPGILAMDRDSITYHAVVHEVLFDDSSDGLPRMACLGVRPPQWGLFLVRKRKGELFPRREYVIEVSLLDDDIIRPTIPPEDHPVIRRSVPISDETAYEVIDAWLAMLRRTSVRETPPTRAVIHMPWYHVSCSDPEFGMISGSAYFPEEGTATADLTEIGWTMVKLAQADEEDRQDLEIEVRARAATLKDRLRLLDEQDSQGPPLDDQNPDPEPVGDHGTK